MSTLSGSSTDAEVEAAYDDNASYLEDNSVSKAQAFITACRILLRRRGVTLSIVGKSITRESIQIEKREAESWAKSRANGRSRRLRIDFKEPQGVD